MRTSKESHMVRMIQRAIRRERERDAYMARADAIRHKKMIAKAMAPILRVKEAAA